jgi:hypothetical protein
MSDGDTSVRDGQLLPPLQHLLPALMQDAMIEAAPSLPASAAPACELPSDLASLQDEDVSSDSESDDNHVLSAIIARESHILQPAQRLLPTLMQGAMIDAASLLPAAPSAAPPAWDLLSIAPEQSPAMPHSPLLAALAPAATSAASMAPTLLQLMPPLSPDREATSEPQPAVPEGSPRSLAQRALELNRKLQRTCRTQLAVIERGIKRNTAARKRGRDACDAEDSTRDEYLQLRLRTSLRPVAMVEMMGDEALRLNDDAIMRAHLVQLVPLRPAAGSASTPWSSAKEREQLRQGVVRRVRSEPTRLKPRKLGNPPGCSAFKPLADAGANPTRRRSPC